MHRIFTAFTAVALAAMVGLFSFAPASAAPRSGMTVVSGSDVVQVQYNGDVPPRRHDRDRRGNWNGSRGYDNNRPGFRQGRSYDRRGYWNGHRGYDRRRPGFRRHSDGFWYPGSAFRIQIR